MATLFIDLDGVHDTGERRVAPPMTIGPKPAIENAERLTLNDEYVHDDRPAPIQDCVVDGEIDVDDVAWAAALGWRHMITSREGATFVRLSQDVFVIAVRGGQFLHDDRHLMDITGKAAEGANEHSWYLVAQPSDQQMLLAEVAPDVYEHLPFEVDGLLYMNTVNRHLVSRRSPRDVVVLVQVSGYGPEERDEAVARLRDVLAARPDVVRD